ncbi:MAG: hypothetical protein E4H03_13150, partial [Myxococcales bacterium]
MGYAAVALLAVAPLTAQAGNIGFTITTTVDTGQGFSVLVDVTNNGDETALAVIPTTEFQGERRRAEGVVRVAPNGKHSWTINLGKAPAPGAYAMIVRLAYEDANAYPFEVIATAPFEVGESKKRPISGAFLIPPVAGKTASDGILRLAFPDGRGDEYDIRFIVPDGLATDRQEHSVSLEKRAPVRLPVT